MISSEKNGEKLIVVKNEFFDDIEIIDYSSEGFGVCRIDGRAVFVRGALLGERWDIKIIKVSKTAVFALGIKLLKASPHRIEPLCIAFGACGGCGLQHMSYEHELEFKLGRVNEALRRIGGLDFEISEIVGADSPERYRNKAIFAVGSGDNGPVTGFFRGRSHEIVPVKSCLLQSEVADRSASALRGFMSKFGIPAYDEKTGGGAIRHLYVRTGYNTKDAMAVIVTAKAIARADRLATMLREACPELTGIVENLNTSRGNTVLSGSFRALWGRDYIDDELLGLRFKLSPQSFYQINPPQAEKLYRIALEYAEPQGETLLDLYCGTGTIGLCMARDAGRVIGAEIVPEAVEDAKANARVNGIDNASFICADAGKAAEMLIAGGDRPDVIVCDPPRKGMDEKTIAAILELSPRRLVYVSCDPATLARDLKALCLGGFAVVEGHCVDLFPRTRHVETCVLLSKLNSKHHIEIDLDMDDMDLTAAESKATYEEIKAYVLEASGLKVSSLYISQVKHKLGLDVGTNYNLPKSESSKQPQCPPKKEVAIIDALRHFKMI